MFNPCSALVAGVFAVPLVEVLLDTGAVAESVAVGSVVVVAGAVPLATAAVASDGAEALTDVGADCALGGAVEAGPLAEEEFCANTNAAEAEKTCTC